MKLMHPMNKIFILFISISSLNISAQSTEINFASSKINELCKTIGTTKKIIGLGESTHGTKEFTTVRAEIVKNLILYYDFKNFVLEAEYIPCSRINEYVLTGKGDPKTLLKDVLLWPWINKDFLDLIIWIKDYNTKHPFAPVCFYGMDSQFSKLYATKDSIRKYYPIKGKSIIEIVESSDRAKVKIKKLRNISKNITNQHPEIGLKLHYYILCRINRIANSKYRNSNARDQNMARLTELIHNKTNKKTMIWAHNGHIWKKKPSLSDNTPAGYYLAKKFKSNYAVVGFDFKEGKFNAVSYDKIDFHKKKTFQLKPIEKTLSMTIDHQDKRLIIVDCSTINHKVYINSIGAIYVSKPQKGDAFVARIKENNEFDYIISVPKSSPTQLLTE